MFDKFRDRCDHAAELRVSSPQQKGDMIVRYLSVDSEYLSRDRTSPDQRLKTISSKALYFQHRANEDQPSPTFSLRRSESHPFRYLPSTTTLPNGPKKWAQCRSDEALASRIYSSGQSLGPTSVQFKGRVNGRKVPEATPDAALRCFLPPFSGPGGRRFKSSRPDHLQNPARHWFTPPFSASLLARFCGPLVDQLRQKHLPPVFLSSRSQRLKLPDSPASKTERLAPSSLLLLRSTL